MTSAAAPGPDGPARAYLSIGEVLGQLRPDFPDVTISKIRFLEDEGLLKPERTRSGYRKFSRDDVGRLRRVLAAQRDHYLPLRVIKEQLAASDRGEPSTAAPAPAAPDAPVLPGPEAFAADASEMRLSRAELLSAAGIDEELLDSLLQYGLLAPRPGGSHFDGDALAVARTAAEMGRWGIQARHLRPFKAAADREIGLLEQVVAPLVRQRDPEARARADETVRELAALCVRLHSTLVRVGLRR